MSVTSEDRAAIDAEHAALLAAEQAADADAEGNGHRSLQQMAADADGAPDEGDQLQLLDLGNAITSTSKGRKPTTSQLKVKSVSVPVAGQMERGEVRSLLLTVKCVAVGFHDKEESDTDRRHVLEPVGTPHILTKEQADLALGVSEE